MRGEPVYRVLFVCTGNTCRSPLAEGIFRDKLARAGLAGRVTVDSAGTNAGNPGGPPDPRAVRVAGGRGIDLSGLRGRAFVPDDFARFDRILVADRRNRDVLLAQAGERDRKKVGLLRGGDAEVADPVFGTERDYERAYDEIDEACDRLLAEVRVELRQG